MPGVPDDQRHGDHYDCAHCDKPLELDPEHPEWEERDTSGAVYHQGCLQYEQEMALSTGNELPLSQEQVDRAIAARNGSGVPQ